VIKQTDGVRRVARGCNDFQSATAQIEAVTVMSISGDLPGPSGIGFRIKSLWQRATNLAGRDFCLRVYPRTARVLPRKVVSIP
jgi:hypothetical protein